MVLLLERRFGVVTGDEFGVLTELDVVMLL